jgi:hypothetical protein
MLVTFWLALNGPAGRVSLFFKIPHKSIRNWDEIGLM